MDRSSDIVEGEYVNDIDLCRGNVTERTDGVTAPRGSGTGRAGDDPDVADGLCVGCTGRGGCEGGETYSRDGVRSVPETGSEPPTDRSFI